MFQWKLQFVATGTDKGTFEIDSIIKKEKEKQQMEINWLT